MELIGSQTERNLRSAISGEAQAAVLYEKFAEKAKREGLETVYDVFSETSKNEKAHAEIYWKLLNCISTTPENLESAALAENHEHQTMYPEFARVARTEGFDDIADTFEMVAKIETEHEARFRQYLCQIKNRSMFSKGIRVTWICNNCGHRVLAAQAPNICPACKHPIGYFSQCADLV